MGPAGAVSLLHKPLMRVLLRVGLEAPNTVEGASVKSPATELLVRELCNSRVKLV